MRLRKPIDFRRAFATGKRIRCSTFNIVAIKNELQYPRLGLAISRKAAARAVDRNRIKRVIRESFRCNAATIGTFDIVVQATPNARTQPNVSLSRKINNLWQKLA